MRELGERSWGRRWLGSSDSQPKTGKGVWDEEERSLAQLLADGLTCRWSKPAARRARALSVEMVALARARNAARTKQTCSAAIHGTGRGCPGNRDLAEVKGDERTGGLIARGKRCACSPWFKSARLRCRLKMLKTTLGILAQQQLVTWPPIQRQGRRS